MVGFWGSFVGPPPRRQNSDLSDSSSATTSVQSSLIWRSLQIIVPVVLSDLSPFSAASRYQLAIHTEYLSARVYRTVVLAPVCTLRDVSMSDPVVPQRLLRFRLSAGWIESLMNPKKR